VKHAGCCNLVALQWLHRNGWVHRDIRPSNIILAHNQLCLMDLEWANNADLGIGTSHPSQEYTPPELVGVDGGKWTSACDMWQFAELITSWGHLDDEGQQFVAAQSLASPAFRRRISAECILQRASAKLVPSRNNKRWGSSNETIAAAAAATSGLLEEKERRDDCRR